MCIVVELHREGSAPAACAADLFSNHYIGLLLKGERDTYQMKKPFNMPNVATGFLIEPDKQPSKKRAMRQPSHPGMIGP